MIRSQLLIFLRNIKKSKTISTINILGLAIGMAACIWIFNFVQFEINYDKVFERSDQIYRLVWNYGTDQYTTRILPIAGEAVKEQISGVSNSIRCFSQDATINLVENPEKAFFEDDIMYTDQAFFDLFNFNSLGSNLSGFKQPYSAILSQEIAKKYFGDRDPIGKAIQVNNMFGQVQYTVQDVIGDMPKNISMQFDILLSNERLFSPEIAYTGIQGWGAFETLILVEENNQIEAINSEINDLVKTLRPGGDERIILQPLEKIHLYSGYINGGQNGILRIYVFSAIALVILILAWFNYINLNTSKAFERAKEVGLRKIFGSGKKRILSQFLLETMLTNLVAFTIALLLSQLLSDILTEKTGIQMTLFENWDTGVFLAFGLILVLGSIISGIVPGWIMTKFKTISIVAGKIKYSDKGQNLRRVLVGAQFGISAMLILVTLTIERQINYMVETDKGLQFQNKVVVEAPRNNDENFLVRLESFTNELKKAAWYQGMSISSSVPGVGYNYGTNAKKSDAEDDDMIEVKVALVDENYIEHYNIELLVGKNFQKPLNQEEQVILNEASITGLGFASNEDAIGQRVYIGKDIKEIIGVVDNYKHNSFHEPIYPTAFRFAEFGNTFSISLSKENHAEVVTYLQDVYNQYFPGNPFNYFFLEDIYMQHYLSDQQVGNLGMLFTVLAIIIACLGLFGFISLTTLQKTKEIGIRKVLGASSQQIFYKLSVEYIVLILLAGALFLPLGIYLSDLWLKDFSFQFTPGLVHYVAPIAILLIISLLTLSYHTVKAAYSNPVNALRYE